MTKESTALKQRIDDLISEADHLSQQPKLLSHWARYLCVLTSALLEIRVREILIGYCGDRSSPAVLNYVETRLGWFRNPKPTKVKDLLNKFDSTWYETLEDECPGAVVEKVSSVVANRNQIAHGRDVGLTFHSMRDYYEATIEFLNKLEKVINGDLGSA